MFLKLDYREIDLGLGPEIGFPLLYLYQVLRRFVWRSETQGDPEVVKRYRQGKLVAKVTQPMLAEHMGWSREATNRAIRKLCALGWLVLDTPAIGGTTYYILGERACDDPKMEYELFYMDGWVQALWSDLMRVVRSHQALEAGTDEDYAYRPHLLPLETRRAVVREFLSKYSPDFLKLVKGGSTPTQEGNTPQSDTSDHGGGDPRITGEVIHGSRGVSSMDHVGGSPLPPDSEVESTTYARHGDCSGIENPNREPRTENKVRGREVVEGTESTYIESSEPKSMGLRNPSSSARLRFSPGEAGGGEAPGARPSPPGSMPVLVVRPAPAGPPGGSGGGLTAARKQELEAEARALAAKAREKDKEAANLALAEDRRGTVARENLGSKGKGSAFLTKAEGYWREDFAAVMPTRVIPRWGPPEKRQVSELAAKYGERVALLVLGYVVNRWAWVNERVFKGTAMQPSIGMVTKLHERLAGEAQAYNQAEEAVRTWWAATQGGTGACAPEVTEQYASAREVLTKLGEDVNAVLARCG